MLQNAVRVHKIVSGLIKTINLNKNKNRGSLYVCSEDKDDE